MASEANTSAEGKVPCRPRGRRAVTRKFRPIGIGILLVLLAVMIFGISPGDEAAMRSFETAAVRWQRNPEYRFIAVEYCILADAALRTHPFGVRGPELVLGARSLPFAPHRFALNPTSERHYSNFSAGPLVAYLFFCDEQSVDQFVGILEAVARKPQPSREDLAGFLQAFHMEYPVCQDAGAHQSVATLVRDTRSDRPFKVRANVGDLLRPYARDLARELNFPAEPGQMSPDQQLAVLVRLDDYVKHRDWELWRTKQLNDFCNGVWAQVYGQHYHLIIDPALAVRQVGVVGLLAMCVWAVFRRRRIAAVPTPAKEASTPS